MASPGTRAEPRIAAHPARLTLARPFGIARGVQTHEDVVHVVLEAGGRTGHGEGTFVDAVGLPCADVVRGGANPLLDAVLAA